MPFKIPGSDVWGDMKLAAGPGPVRFECQAKTNSSKFTSSGDTLAVQFAMKEIRIEAAFGSFKLPVSLIKSVRVSVLGKIGRPRDGLIGLWSGEGNAVDSVGGNNGGHAKMSASLTGWSGRRLPLLRTVSLTALRRSSDSRQARLCPDPFLDHRRLGPSAREWLCDLFPRRPSSGP